MKSDDCGRLIKCYLLSMKIEAKYLQNLKWQKKYLYCGSFAEIINLREYTPWKSLCGPGDSYEQEATFENLLLEKWEEGQTVDGIIIKDSSTFIFSEIQLTLYGILFFCNSISSLRIRAALGTYHILIYFIYIQYCV